MSQKKEMIIILPRLLPYCTYKITLEEVYLLKKF